MQHFDQGETFAFSLLWIFPFFPDIGKQTEQQADLYKNLIPGTETAAAFSPAAAPVYALCPK